MLERQIMLKQSQEQQRQESDGPKQPSLTHDKYALDLNIGIRVRDPSQMFMFRDTKWVRGSSNPPLTHFRFPNPSRESAGAFTKHISQQAGKSFIGSQTSGSVDRNSADLGSAAVEASNLIKSGNHPQPWLYNKSSNFPAPNSSCNAFVLLHKVDKEHAYSVSINQVPKSESDDAFAPSYLNKPSQSPKCENNRLSDRNYLKSHLVSVKKKEDGQTRSTQPATIQLDARVEQNLSVTESCEIPSISYAAASWIRNTSPAHLQQLDVAKPEEGSLKSTKRKFSAFERLPWHEEVTEASSSSAELEGEHYVVRQSKKMKVLAGDAAHSRLDLTTQLMQRLFQPPPATVLSQDAINHCDTVAYYASKLALRGACSLCVEARRNMTCKSRRFQDLSKTIQGFADRSKRVENAVSRLEKSSSWIGEVQMDFEGLEAFAIVDRVAEFHLRRPVVRRRDTSTPKHDPQRYVKACPVPKTVPEGQNCVSL